ncbi:transposase [Tardiphaga sp. vice304]|uniref:IS66-like element accessory protein TnpA n=1 Tax=unclassified Tardiphaga TaxID=2631404 RepID=UPI0011657878|nr:MULTISPECIES: transposase [unclassified Tardiphaga]QDM20592.1 transposase [Tardiphaga sp. vice154]QDM25720.1 transposase [Tardiphaga sp. vice304]
MARPRKHRHWSDEEKRSICCQSKTAGIFVAQVARRYAMSANLIFKWLNDPRYAPDNVVEDTQTFLSVEIEANASADTVSLAEPPATTCSGGAGRFEIILPDGLRLKVDGEFDGSELARLIKGLMA